MIRVRMMEGCINIRYVDRVLVAPFCPLQEQGYSRPGRDGGGRGEGVRSGRGVVRE